jgi:hypothetical protein
MTPWEKMWPKNVWLGTTVENADFAKKRLPLLLKHPAAVRFLSCEPLLGPIDLRPWFKWPCRESNAPRLGKKSVATMSRGGGAFPL